MWAKYVAAVTAVVSVLVAARAEDVLAPIREFDIATIEAMGQHIYRQDQLAWKATDILMKDHTPAELQIKGLHGWIVDETADRDMVRFIRDSKTGPEAFYDVTFAAGVEPILSEPKDRTLTPEELAQYNARLLAAQSFDFRCSDTPPNTVAFRDPQNKGWLVWVMTATRDPDAVVMAGHMRFTVSDDGKSIIQADKLSRGCMVNTMPHGKAGEEPVAQAFSNIVSIKPVETQVFTNLAYKLPLYVSTLDGIIWKIDGGHITTVDLDAPDVDGATARVLAGADETCTPILASKDGPKPTFTLGKSIQVISPTEHDRKLAVDVPDDQRLAEVMCARYSLVPAPNDYKVLMAGATLAIYDRGAGHANTTLRLSLQHGKIVYDVIDGPPLSDELKARVEARLKQLQDAYKKDK